MTAAVSFDLRRAVRAAVDETGLASPRDIAAKVAEGVPAKHLRLALEQALVDYVRDEVTRHRTFAPVAPSASAKVSAIRAAAEVWRTSRVHVGNGRWEFLADCSYENLLFAAEERREHARRNAAQAEHLANLAELVRSHGAARVGDIADDVLRAYFGGAA